MTAGMTGNFGGMAGNASPPTLVSPAAPSPIIGTSWPGRIRQNNGGPNTLSDIITCEAPFNLVRLMWMNSAQSVGTISKAGLNVSASINDGFTPVNAVGSSLNASWITATFNNGGADIGYEAQIQAPVSGATVASGGSGGTNGTQTVTVMGCLGGTAPQLSVTVSGGAISAVLSVVTAGACSYIPTSPVLVSGAGLVGATLNLTQTAVTTFTIAAAQMAQEQVPCYSDWMAVPGGSIARTDGGTGYLLFTRTYVGSGLSLTGPVSGVTSLTPVLSASIASGGAGYLSGGSGFEYLTCAGFTSPATGLPPTAQVSIVNGVATAVTQFPTAVWASGTPSNPVSTTTMRSTPGAGATLTLTTGAASIQSVTGRAWIQCFSAGDCVTTPASFSLAARGPGALAGAQFIAQTPGFTVAQIGDSIGEGLGSTAGCTSFLARACILISTPAKPVSWFNMAQGAEITANFVENALHRLAAARPSVLCVQAWSANDMPGGDSGTATASDTCWINCMRICAYAKTLGIPVIIYGPVPQPNTCTDAAQDASRLSINTRAQNWALGNGFYFLNLNQILGDTSVPVNYQPYYDAGDNKHPNDQAQSAVAAVLAPMLSKVCGLT